MGADMVLDRFRHQTVRRAARGGNEMHHLLAPGLAVERPLDRLDLAADSSHARQQLLLVPDRVGHASPIAYPLILFERRDCGCPPCVVPATVECSMDRVENRRAVRGKEICAAFWH